MVNEPQHFMDLSVFSYDWIANKIEDVPQFVGIDIEMFGKKLKIILFRVIIVKLQYFREIFYIDHSTQRKFTKLTRLDIRNPITLWNLFLHILFLKSNKYFTISSLLYSSNSGKSCITSTIAPSFLTKFSSLFFLSGASIG